MESSTVDTDGNSQINMENSGGKDQPKVKEQVNGPRPKVHHPHFDKVNAKDRWGRLKTTMTAVNHVPKKKLDRGDSFLRKFSTRHQSSDKIAPQADDLLDYTYRGKKHATLATLVIHPSGEILFYWLGVVTLSVLYNLWTCIAREAFREIQDGYRSVWFTLDAFCDLIYILDVIAQFRTGYLQQGLMVYESSKLYRNYMRNKCFIIDLVCLLPLDFLQFYFGIHALLRFPRFLKAYRAVRFMHIYESRTAYPNLLRVSNLTHTLFLGAHWFAAFYYLISEAEGFKGDWSYPKPEGTYAAVTRKYLASLYWSTLTLTTIGDLPPPDTNWQYVFVIVSYLIGVFIFATIVGQVGNVITNRNASRQEFERLLDGAKFYMQTHNVPTELQKRVQRWYDYVWTRGRLNCNDINSLGLLPDKLKTELALHVNLETLKKVTIFQKCRPEFLHDLMLKMRAYIFTPGDLICRRGEVAREMFIIADGVVEIIGESSTVLTQMSTGDFFGEIGILNLDGGINRRTADVRSVGYSELFVLSREDVLAALKDHPDAETILTGYARQRLQETLYHRQTSLSVSHELRHSDVTTLSSIEEREEPYAEECATQSDVRKESSSEEEYDTEERTEDHESSDTEPEEQEMELNRTFPSKSASNRRASLHIPTSFGRFSRRVSCPTPPLDLPIEVPRASIFRGIRPSTTSSTAAEMEDFKNLIDQRLTDLERSYQLTVQKLEQTSRSQEELMRTILHQINVMQGESARKPDKDSTDSSAAKPRLTFQSRDTEETHL